MPRPSPIETYPDDRPPRPLLRDIGTRGTTNVSSRVSEFVPAAFAVEGMEQAAPLLAANRMEDRKLETSFTSESKMETPKRTPLETPSAARVTGDLHTMQYFVIISSSSVRLHHSRRIRGRRLRRGLPRPGGFGIATYTLFHTLSCMH